MSGDLVLNLDMWPQKMTANVSFPHGDRFEGGKFISKRGGRVLEKNWQVLSSVWFVFFLSVTHMKKSFF